MSGRVTSPPDHRAKNCDDLEQKRLVGYETVINSEKIANIETKLLGMETNISAILQILREKK